MSLQRRTDAGGPLFDPTPKPPGISHLMHKNSDAAHRAVKAKLGTRAREVMDYLREHGPSTDREVQRGMGFAEKSAVQPTISALIRAGLLREIGSKTDLETGKANRVVAV